MHGVGFDKVCWRGGKFFRIGFYDGDGAGRLPMRKSINEDGGFVAVLQGIGEVETANPEVDNADRLGEGALHQATDNFDAKSVVAEEDVSDAGDEDFLLGRKEEVNAARVGLRFPSDLGDPILKMALSQQAYRDTAGLSVNAIVLRAQAMVA